MFFIRKTASQMHIAPMIVVNCCLLLKICPRCCPRHPPDMPQMSPSGHQVVTKWSPSSLQVVSKQSPSGHHVVTKWQCGLICGAIKESTRSLKAIDECVFTNFCDRNDVFTIFCDKNAVFTHLWDKMPYLQILRQKCRIYMIHDT